MRNIRLSTCRFRLLLIAAALIVAGAQVAAATELQLIDFEIKDQFESAHTQQELKGRILIVVGADRKGKEFSDVWVEVVRDTLESTNRLDSVLLVSVANVKGVPFFVKGKVKKMFPSDLKWTSWKKEYSKGDIRDDDLHEI